MLLLSIEHRDTRGPCLGFGPAVLLLKRRRVPFFQPDDHRNGRTCRINHCRLDIYDSDATAGNSIYFFQQTA